LVHAVNIRSHEANFYEFEARCHEAEIEAEAEAEADVFNIPEKDLTQQKHAFANPKKCRHITTQNKHKKLKPGS